MRTEPIDVRNLKIVIEANKKALEMNRLPTIALLERCLFTLGEKDRHIVELESGYTCKVEALQREIERLTDEVARLESQAQSLE